MRHEQLVELINKKGQVYTDISEWTQDDLKEIVLAGIKFICSWGRFKKENVRLDSDILDPLQFSKKWISTLNWILNTATYLTPKSFTELFHEETKDTEDILSGMEWNKPIGTREKLFKLIGNCRNRKIKTAFMTCISAEIDALKVKNKEMSAV